MAKRLFESGNYVIVELDDGTFREYEKKLSSYSTTPNIDYRIVQVGKSETVIENADIANWITSESGSTVYTETTLKEFLRRNLSKGCCDETKVLVSETEVGVIPCQSIINTTVYFDSTEVTPLSSEIIGTELSINIPAVGGAGIVGAVNKTGQTTTRFPFDDGAFRFGNGVDWFTLRDNNAFGNNDAFTDLDGLQVYGDNIMLCHNSDQSRQDMILGFYMISRTGRANDSSIGANDGALYICNTDSWAGFATGWHLPSAEEMRILKRFEGGTLGYPFNWPPLNESSATYYWTSTNNSSENFYSMVNNGAHTETFQSPSIAYRYLSCRWFTYAELGI